MFIRKYVNNVKQTRWLFYFRLELGTIIFSPDKLQSENISYENSDDKKT